tara:strand:- start:63 stop:941 length:879 start_codon:yes stop_codon:yes gene_type:complete
MLFDGYFGIDWSGDKSKFQKGIKVAYLDNKNVKPIIISPPNEKRYWDRISLIEYFQNLQSTKAYLIGFDFAFAYPFNDSNNYFVDLENSPKSPKKLWDLIDNHNVENSNYYGGNIWKKKYICEYYNSPIKRGVKFKSRRRVTEIYAKKICSPSPTFNCVGPGAVGTGSLAGMRVLKILNNKFNIWPFDNIKNNKKSVIVEIFPTLYFRKHSIRPKKHIGYTLSQINYVLKKYDCLPVSRNLKMFGPDQDEADALISAAALRYFSKNLEYWKTHKAGKKEGWIYGVKFINDKE